jgi:hypothetical protein
VQADGSSMESDWPFGLVIMTDEIGCDKVWAECECLKATPETKRPSDGGPSRPPSWGVSPWGGQDGNTLTLQGHRSFSPFDQVRERLTPSRQVGRLGGSGRILKARL